MRQLQDHERAQNTEVLENGDNSGANENSNTSLNQSVNGNLSHHSALIPVNSFEERTTAAENGVQNQIKAYRSINNILRSWEYMQEHLCGNVSFANSIRTPRSRRIRTRIATCRGNHGQPKLFKSMNKTKNTLKKIRSLLMQRIDIALSDLSIYD